MSDPIDDQESKGADGPMTVEPTRVTIATYFCYDNVAEGTLVRHDGKIVWHEKGWGYLDQYLRWVAPKGPVLLEYGDQEELSINDLL